MKDLISVIIPCYKVDKYLNKCVETVVNQSYKNLEIILVEDGSPDDCGKICDEWAKKDQRVIAIHKQNGGLSSARNAGIDVAKGKYIMFIDSDDYIDLNMIETMYSNIIETNSDMCICNYLWEYPKKIKKKTFSSKKIVIEGNKIFDFLYNEYFLLTVVSWNKLYNKKLFDNVRFPNGKIHEDQYVICDILEQTNKVIYLLDEYFYHYVQRDGSIMSSFNMKRFNIIDALDRRIDFFEQKKDTERVLLTKAVEALELIDLLQKLKGFEFNNDDQNQINKYKNKLDKIIDELYNENRLSGKYKYRIKFYHKFPRMFLLLKKIKSLIN